MEWKSITTHFSRPSVDSGIKGIAQREGLECSNLGGGEVALWGSWVDLLKKVAASKSVFRMKGTVSFSVFPP